MAILAGKYLKTPLLIAATFLLLSAAHATHRNDELRVIQLSTQEAKLIGAKIFQNECAGKKDCLVAWNEGENFPSLGIGHLIWYPTKIEGQFYESFPALVDLMKQQHISLPEYFAQLEPFDAPWPTRNHFLAVEHSQPVTELRNFLATHSDIQIYFMVTRSQQALRRILDNTAPHLRQQLTHKINTMLSSPLGVYPLIDYVNFKGEGLLPSETYQSQGWGLKQVLLQMPRAVTSENVRSEFAEAAKQVLWRRVNNASNPIEKDRWFPAWVKRINTYYQQ